MTKDKSKLKLLRVISKKTLDFEIIPIFNQAAPGIWYNFVYIESVCDTELYKLSPPTQPIIETRLLRYKEDLHENKHNFAFGAYKGKRMIGFAQGVFCNIDEVYLNKLFVLPKYHKCGIGTQLLKATEQASSMIATQISLTPLAEAVDFYKQKHRYANGDNMHKGLIPPENTIIPVFQWIKKDFNVKFAIPVDTMELKQNKYQPIFVHTNNECKIDAVATRMPNGEKKLWTPINKLNADSIKLLNTLDKIR